MEFIKMHGLGNDYVFVDCLDQNVENPESVARQISRRHFSVGSDGLILIQKSKMADFKMKMYNADGSAGSMCGNGIRCVGKYVYEHGKTEKTKLLIETDAGIRSIVLHVQEGTVRTVRVDMGIPDFVPEHIPVRTGRKYVLDELIEAGGVQFRINCLSMGNPHCVIFQENVDDCDLQRFGPALEHHAIFPDRVNVEFAEIIDYSTLKMRVWERGSGETYACGTGACAAAAAACVNGFCNRRITVRLTGGELDICWSDEDNHIYMTGPAVEVCRGIWEPH